MISFLSNSFRATSLYEAPIRSILAVQPLKIQLRFKSVEEKLGLPTKPKKPIAPYFRFLIENRPSVVAKHPTLKTSEINSILGKMWRTLDANDKKAFSDGYKTELIDYYANEYNEYRSTLSEDDKRKIKQTKLEVKKRRALVAEQRKLRKLGKPKKPFNAYFRYYTSIPQTERKPNEQSKEFVKRITTRWNGLSDSEKEKYKTSAEEEANYKKALLQWEQEMLKLNHNDIVRGAKKELTKKKDRGSTDK